MNFKSTDLSIVKSCSYHPKGHIHSADKEGSKLRRNLWVDLNEENSNGNNIVVVIGINPSTASAKSSDNTLTKTSRTMYSLGFNRLYMLNLFESRSVKQDGIDKNTCTDFCNEENSRILKNANAIIIAWGLCGYEKEKENALKNLNKYKGKLFCISKDKKYPYHPRVWQYNEKFKITRFELK